MSKSNFGQIVLVFEHLLKVALRQIGPFNLLSTQGRLMAESFGSLIPKLEEDPR